MGNRAIVVFPEANVYVYLHWNGGPESVYAFLDYAKATGNRTDNYGPARFCQIVGNFFGGTTSLGIEGLHAPNGLEELDCGDNGIYVLKGWAVDRRFAPPGRFSDSRWFTAEEIAAEEAAARKSKYWTDAEETIMQGIAKANDKHFLEAPTAKAA